jgi:hypothetical protein
MSSRRFHGAATVFWLAASAPGLACGWANLDALETAPLTAEVGSPDTSVDVKDLDARSMHDASDRRSTEAGQKPDAGALTFPCTNTETTVMEWTFDTSVSGWLISAQTDVQASLAWTSAEGKPSPGALQIEVTPRESDAGATSGAWPQFGMKLGDLSGRTISAWAWLDSGPSPELKFFVQTGSQWVWADNGTVHLSPKVWTCVSLPVSSPAYSGENYDPTDVVRLGFQVFGVSPFRLFVDTVRIF